MLVIIISSLLNLIYFFRVIENVYMSGEGGAVVKRSKGGLEITFKYAYSYSGVGCWCFGFRFNQ